MKIQTFSQAIGKKSELIAPLVGDGFVSAVRQSEIL